MTSMYEPVANTDLARLLDGMTGPATVEPEPPDALPGGRRPDLLITAPGRSPVVIEARRLPAANLEIPRFRRAWSLLMSGVHIWTRIYAD